jgi:hypothetical protein
VISESALRGYVLEELLAAYLKSSGYDLLVDEKQDAAALCGAGNGLRVRGRGADHQADVLGQLRLRLPFMHPLRLFVEAKYRADPTGLADVRNALGVVNDVNEHYSWSVAASSTSTYVRYHYRYVLFSATGFTADAQRFAITQQISLVDLRGDAFEWILDASARVANELKALAESASLTSFPVNQAREALRRALGTWPMEEVADPEDLAEAVRRASQVGEKANGKLGLPAGALAEIAAHAGELDGRLYLGFTDAPYVILLQADDSEVADEFLRSSSNRRSTRLAFAGVSPERGEWSLTTEGLNGRVTFRMAMAPELEPWVLGAGVEEVGIDTLQSPARSITIALGDAEAELQFDPVPIRETTQVSQKDYLRLARLESDLAFRGDANPAEGEPWSFEAARELLRRLRSEGKPHADIIEYAAKHDGIVSRATVYKLAGYPSHRMLRSFTTPVRRIMRDLVRDHFVSEDAELPLQTQYMHGVLATHFVVPREFIHLLA